MVCQRITAFRDERDESWPKGLYRREASYRYRRMVDGNLLLEVLGDIPLCDAIRRVQRYNLEVEEGRNPVEDAKRTSTTFDQFSEEWLSIKSTTMRRKSHARYREAVTHFKRFLTGSRGAGTAIARLTDADAIGYVQYRRTTPIMPNGRARLTQALRQGAAKKTIHSEVTTLRQMFRLAVQRNLLPRNPFEEVRVAKPKRQEVAAKHRPLTEAEEVAFLQAAAEMDKSGGWSSENASFHDVFLFFLKTGLRENELRFLEWTDADWDLGLLHIREKAVTETRTVDVPPSVADRLRRLVAGREPDAPLFRNDGELASFDGVLPIRERDALRGIVVGDVDLAKLVITTTRRFRWSPKATQGDVPMCKVVRDMLTRLQKTKRGNFVFAHRDGGSCRLQLWEMVKEAQKRAGIPGNLRLHDLRHTFAVRLRQRKTPLEVIMGLMRHADIHETLIYAPYDIDEGKAAIKVLDQ